MEAAIGPRPMADARVGQKTGITRRWARRGTRPSAPKDLRTISLARSARREAWRLAWSCHIATPKRWPPIWPKSRAHVAHVAHVARGAQAVLILDQAGWHASAALSVPDNITLFPLPPKCPELNPVENIWQFLRDNWLSNTIFATYDDIVQACCKAWNNLNNQPERITSIGLRKWAHG